MSAHRWQSTTPQSGEMSRRVCVVCDVFCAKRPVGGVTLTSYSRDGKSWSQAMPECKAPAHVGAEQAVRS